MITDNQYFTNIPTPYYILEESKLRNNLSLIKEIAERSEVEIILAFKAFALWKSFPIFREYIGSTTASSPFEALLAAKEFGKRAHTYSPAYTSEDFPTLLECSSHITFNSLTQYARFYEDVVTYTNETQESITCGLRINPEYSEVEVELYNPCAVGTRFGVMSSQLSDVLPKGITGFHCHCHCESNSYDLERTLVHIEEKFGRWFSQISWLNLGGGHLMTRADYDVEHLIKLLKSFKLRYPHLHIILEPGSAFAWQTGVLLASIVDIVENKGVKTAILDVSFTCHMPDCLEMPYQPTVRGAETLPADASKTAQLDEPIYRLGGNSCLSGDYMGTWRFDHVLEVGERIIFEDMIHYTTVKTNMFNGIKHPAIGILRLDGQLENYRQFVYEDYRDRMC